MKIHFSRMRFKSHVFVFQMLEQKQRADKNLRKAIGGA